MPKTIDEILEICLKKIKHESATVEECMTAFPQYRNELQDILPLMVSLQSLKGVEPSPQFSKDAAHRLVSKLPAAPVTFWESVRLIFKRKVFTPIRRFSMPQIIVSIIIAISLLTGGSYAVQASGPGDLLYGLDIALEQTRLALTTNPQKQVTLRLQYATERLEEMEKLLGRDRDEHAIKAMVAYGQAINEIEEFIENEEGLNREAVRAMVQEELALQQGILDRVRLSWPDDAQARSAYQTALQRSNMGVDTLLGPPEIAPQGPPEDVPQGPAGENAQGPGEEVPQGPKEEAPQGPGEDEPFGPAEDAPYGSSEEAPYGPPEEAPHGPSGEAPRGPTQDAQNGKDN